MSVRLSFLDVVIPVLEAKLQAFKRERKSLRASQQMREQWKDPAFRATQLQAGDNNHGWNVGGLKRHTDSIKLPWPKGSKLYNRYSYLLKKGWSREEAIARAHVPAKAYSHQETTCHAQQE